MGGGECSKEGWELNKGSVVVRGFEDVFPRGVVWLVKAGGDITPHIPLIH